jgi:hypothetical protein
VLSYTTESLRKIAGKLSKDGIKVSHVTIGKILEDNGYSASKVIKKCFKLANHIPIGTNNSSITTVQFNHKNPSGKSWDEVFFCRGGLAVHNSKMELFERRVVFIICTI